MSQNNIFMMLSKEEGVKTPIHVFSYHVPTELLDDSNECKILNYFRGIAADYLCTKEGNAQYRHNNGKFDWNDFSLIPDSFLEKYEVHRIEDPYIIAEVMACEDLSHGNHVNYQIMGESNLLDNGKYMPDWDRLIENASSEDEKQYLETVRADQLNLINPGRIQFRSSSDRHMAAVHRNDAGFAFNMVYVSKMNCGHYEIFQTPCSKYHTLKTNLRLAREHASHNKCSRCITNLPIYSRNVKCTDYDRKKADCRNCNIKQHPACGRIFAFDLPIGTETIKRRTNHMPSWKICPTCGYPIPLICHISDLEKYRCKRCGQYLILQ